MCAYFQAKNFSATSSMCKDVTYDADSAMQSDLKSIDDISMLNLDSLMSCSFGISCRQNA